MAMTTMTARFGLPLLAPGQAQKEMFHNEAISAIDALLNAAVEAVDVDDPPAVALVGQSWIVGAMPTGAWVGHAQALANWTDGGWRFHMPIAGMRAILRVGGHSIVWNGTGWRQGELSGARVMIGGRQVVGAQGTTISHPSGGVTVDVEARAALAAILSALATHGLIA